MTIYKTLNVKLSNLQLNISLNFIGGSNDEANLTHKSIVTNTKVSRIRKAFANGSSGNTKF